MSIPEFVKPAPSYWQYLPYFKHLRGVYLFGKVYLKKEIYENLNNPSPDPYFESILVHELKHKEQVEKTGYIIFSIKYLFSRNFRLNSELEAIKAQITFLKSKDIKYPYIERTAKALSSWVYLWAGDYAVIKTVLDSWVRK